LECADSGRALDFLGCLPGEIQSGVALRLPPRFKLVSSSLLNYKHFAPSRLLKN
jgi:hypothetical protein